MSRRTDSGVATSAREDVHAGQDTEPHQPSYPRRASPPDLRRACRRNFAARSHQPRPCVQACLWGLRKRSRQANCPRLQRSSPRAGRNCLSFSQLRARRAKPWGFIMGGEYHRLTRVNGGLGNLLKRRGKLLARQLRSTARRGRPSHTEAGTGERDALGLWGAPLAV